MVGNSLFSKKEATAFKLCVKLLNYASVASDKTQNGVTRFINVVNIGGRKD